jgi:hypothetical protein
MEIATLSKEKIRELLCAGAKLHRGDLFLECLAGAVCHADEHDFNLLRPAALVFIAKYQLS